MKQFLIALFPSMVSFGVVFAIFHNAFAAGIVAAVVLFYAFFGLCIVAKAHDGEELGYPEETVTSDQ
jgi:hypothetical protein